jgi:hypothetical protein
VPNWNISRNYKKMWNSTKISVTLGMRLTRGGRVQRPLTCGPSGWSVGHTLQPPVSFLGGDALQEAVEWNPRPGVGGGCAPWPAGQHLVNYQLNQVANCSWDSYKYLPTDGIQNTTLYLYFSTCKGSGFVVEAQVRPCWESSRVFARAPKVVSEIGELFYPYLSL